MHVLYGIYLGSYCYGHTSIENKKERISFLTSTKKIKLSLWKSLRSTCSKLCNKNNGKCTDPDGETFPAVERYMNAEYTVRYKLVTLILIFSV